MDYNGSGDGPLSPTGNGRPDFSHVNSSPAPIVNNAPAPVTDSSASSGSSAVPPFHGTGSGFELLNQGGAGRGWDSQNQAIMNSPSDLICPITWDLFVDPVANAVGQTYERAAIEEHLLTSLSDPVTRQKLPHTRLTPIFLLRSRSMEYRESTVRACLEAAATPSCLQPATLVRRAADLCTGLLTPVADLSVDCMAYVASLPSNASDDEVMKAFARSLNDSGRREDAAYVYCNLLQACTNNRVKQAELLRLSMDCWAPPGVLSLPGASNSARGLDPTHGAVPSDFLELETALFRKLAAFVTSQTTFSWGQIIDILQEAGLSATFTLRLCEHLLEEGGHGSKMPASYLEDRQAMCQYIKITRSVLSNQQQQTDASLVVQSVLLASILVEKARISAELASIKAEQASMKAEQARILAQQRKTQHTLGRGPGPGDSGIDEGAGVGSVQALQSSHAQLQNPRWPKVRSVAVMALLASVIVSPGGSLVIRALKFISSLVLAFK